MSFVKVALAFFFLFALAHSGAPARQAPASPGGQSNRPPSVQRCPTVTVSCPDTWAPGGPVTFKANVSGGDPDVTPTFKWTVSDGTITAGQETASVKVDVTGVISATVTATVDVGGLDRACVSSASCTANPGCVLPPARKLDEYGAIPFGDEKARLDNFAAELRNDPASEGYLLCYGGRRGAEGEAQRRCERARNYLVSARAIDRRRLADVDGGFREDPAVELWLVSPGATPPLATPTVDPSEVRPAAPRAGRRRGQ